MKEASIREKLFCLYYLENGGVGARASRDAGYSAKTAAAASAASQLLKRDRVKKFLAEKRKEMEEKLEVTFDWKIKKLRQCVDAAMLEDAETGKVLLDNHTALLGAISELNKMQGHYSAEKIHNVHVVAEAEFDEIKALTAQYEKQF